MKLTLTALVLLALAAAATASAQEQHTQSAPSHVALQRGLVKVSPPLQQALPGSGPVAGALNVAKPKVQSTVSKKLDQSAGGIIQKIG